MALRGNLLFSDGFSLRRLTSFLIGSVCAMCAIVALPVTAAVSASAQRVWYEHILAHVTVGYDVGNKSEVQRRVYLAVLGPENTQPFGLGEVGYCAKVAGDAAGQSVRSFLEKTNSVREGPSPATAASGMARDGSKNEVPAGGSTAALPSGVSDVKTASDHVLPPAVVDAALTQANQTLANQLASCLGVRARRLDLRLGLVQRHCAVGACQMDDSSFATNPSAANFSTILDWLTQRSATASTPKANEMAVLPPGTIDEELRPYFVGQSPPVKPVACAKGRPTGVVPPIAAPAPAAAGQTAQPLPNDALRWAASSAKGQAWYCLAQTQFPASPKEANPWIALPDAKSAQEQFEALAQRARTQGFLIEQSVGRTIALPREVGVRLIDVVSNPSIAVAELVSKPDAVLLTMQDEIARNRLRECVRYRNEKGPQAASLCAGYQVDEGQLASCLAGGKCLPALTATGRADVLGQLASTGGAQLAQSSLLPRLGIKENELVDLVRKCASQEAVPEDQRLSKASECYVDGQIGMLGEKERKEFECLKAASASGLSAKDLSCVAERLPPEVHAGVECLNAKDSLACMLDQKLPADAKATVQCERANPGNTQAQGECLAGRLGGDVGKVAAAASKCKDAGPMGSKEQLVCLAGEAGGEVGKVAACYDPKGDSAAMAMCVAGGALPKPMQDALKCASKDTFAQGATCLASSGALGVELPKEALCAVESGGDPFGFGACMVGDNLTAEQKIILQCFMQTGGVPQAMATCIGGRLVMKELMNCTDALTSRDKKLFDDKCMGENNDVRKLLSRLGIDVGSNTVVGQALNLPLDVVKWQVAAAQAVLGGVSDFGRNADKELRDFSKRAEQAVDQGLKDAAQEGKKLAQHAANQVGAVVDDAGKYVKIAEKVLANPTPQKIAQGAGQALQTGADQAKKAVGEVAKVFGVRL